MAGNTSYILAALRDYTEEDRARVDAQDDKGRTPLHLAAQYGHEESVKILIDLRADPTLQDSTGKTAMQVGSTPAIRTFLYLHREPPPPYKEPEEQEQEEAIVIREMALETF